MRGAPCDACSAAPPVLLGWLDHLPAALLAGVPALIVLVLVDRLDARGDEPRWLLRRAAAMGAAAVLPALALELLLALAGLPVRGVDAWTIAVSSLVVVALSEEACKAGALSWLLARRLAFEHRRDGARYGARVGLGFALVENVYYGLLLDAAEPLLLTIAARTVLTVPMHAVWAAIVGDDAARRHVEGQRAWPWHGLAIAILGHGLFDFGLAIAQLASARGDTPGFAAAVALVLAVAAASVIVLRQRVRAALLQDAEAEARTHT